MTNTELWIVGCTAFAFFVQALMMLGLARRLRKAEASIGYLRSR